jgi:nicotinate-nucleotide pyrophosphorylase (carboxylating)
LDNPLQDLVARALAEDVGEGDMTSDAVVPADALANARVVQKQEGVLFGLEAAEETFRQAGAESFERLAAEREWRGEVPSTVARATGPARALLAAERTALNLLCHLSGIATLTARYVRAVDGAEAEILDTRKTTPGLRALEKAASRRRSAPRGKRTPSARLRSSAATRTRSPRRSARAPTASCSTT